MQLLISVWINVLTAYLSLLLQMQHPISPEDISFVLSSCGLSIDLYLLHTYRLLLSDIPRIVVLSCWEIKHSSSNLKLPTLNIKIKRPRLNLLHPKASFDLWLKQLIWTFENKRNFYFHGIKLGPLKKIVWNVNIIVT